ncbi:putative gustatory receptor 28b [Cotesia glomerata]|uniref:putative gustatory receptor 28b n=1 Tax=Cotesia glomerata TaxID=32391 RepID=UPI001D0252D9|nr:putative gustatory receptor 28b [Cotesia glomerata]
MWKPANVIEAMLPIFLVNAIFCHGIFQYPHLDKSKLYYSLIFSITTTIVFFMFFMYVFLNWTDRFLSTSPKGIYYVNTGIMILAMIINVIAGWTHKDKSMKINLRVIKVDKTLKKLGVPVNAEKEFYIIIMIVFIWIIFLLFLDISHIVSTEKSDDLSEKTMRSIILQHGHHVNILINAIFCLFVKHMKIRFKSLNKVLLDIFQLQDNDSKHKKNTDYKWAVSRRINFEKDFMKILHDVKRIHLELGILCREITKIYGIPIVLSMITAFINISSLILITYIIIIMSPQNPNFDKSVIVSSLLLWVIVFSLRIFVINYNCAECILEWKKTGEIIHTLEFDSKNKEFQEEIKQFSIQILQNPLKFSPCGLFDLGYYFLRDFAGTVTAQIILSIQTYRFTSK